MQGAVDVWLRDQRDVLQCCAFAGGVCSEDEDVYAAVADLVGVQLFVEQCDWWRRSGFVRAAGWMRWFCKRRWGSELGPRHGLQLRENCGLLIRILPFVGEVVFGAA